MKNKCKSITSAIFSWPNFWCQIWFADLLGLSMCLALLIRGVSQNKYKSFKMSRQTIEYFSQNFTSFLFGFFLQLTALIYMILIWQKEDMVEFKHMLNRSWLTFYSLKNYIEDLKVPYWLLIYEFCYYTIDIFKMCLKVFLFELSAVKWGLQRISCYIFL